VTFVVPAVLGGLAIAVMALVSFAAQRRARAGQRAAAQALAGPRILVHSINDDRCTGCDACVAVCPTNVLDLVDNKSRVLRFQDCIQCEACMWACPTTALVMHPEGAHPPNYKMPELDEHYQTKVPGQYLIGEVAGKPLVKNAANLGRAVVEHMLATGLRPSPAPGGGGPLQVDVAIVGSGPGGLSAALTCMQRGLSYVVLEKENIIASTVSRYPKGKLVMAEPYDTTNLSLLPVFDSSKEELVPVWRELVERSGMLIKMGETVEKATRRADGLFDIRSNVGSYVAQRVILATGTRGKPRTLNVVGENLPKVFSLLEDPDNHGGQTVCVVGGGDSALEAAIALADAGARVILSYRGKSFSRAQPKNRQIVEQYEAQRRVKVKYESEVVEIAGDTITLQMRDGTQKRYPNEAVFVLIGADPPIEWLAKMGILFVERPHMFALPKSDELVKRFVADAIPCPQDAASALALVQGRAPAAVLAAAPAAEESRARKFIRSATGIFATNKLDKPMPLSEFARQRRHDGRGRRDQLDARERTRVLRMLRDDGGRLADEDSKLYVIDRRSSERSDVAIVAQASPPPALAGREARAARPSSPPPVPPRRAGSPDLLSTLPPTTRSPLRNLPPVEAGGPKPAVIVGLARAAAQGPRKRASRPPPPVFHDGPTAFGGGASAETDEPTRQLPPEQARALLDRRVSAGPDEPTEFTRALPDEDRTSETALPPDDAATALHAIEPVGSPPAGRPRARLPAPPHQRGHDDPTRNHDLRAGTLSEVDWDLE
jgi:thioredoxin reductase (NADPH)